MMQKKWVVMSFLIGAAATYVGFALASSGKTLEEEFDDDMEAKIEIINQQNQSKIDPEKYILTEGCEIDEEIQIITRRSACLKAPQKATKSWKDLAKAEADVLKFLKEKDMQSLQDYTSCDATDLTWYELHCEADRLFIDDMAYDSLFKHFDLIGSSVLEEANWIRVSSFEKKIRNPLWITRSRLKATDMKLGDPWREDRHPTEHETIILLEQRLDGQVYISGIPVTGVLIQDDQKVAEK